MLTLIGDILNWSVAAVLFPLMLLPLAATFARDRLAGSLLWLVIVAAVVGLGAVFVTLAPRLGPAPGASSLTVFAGAVAALALFVAIAGGPRRAAARLAPLAEAVSRGAGRLVMWLAFAMAFVQFAGVILRYVFGVSILAMTESVTYMHGAVFLIAAGYALLSDDQVRVDIFYRDAPPKRKALIDLLGTYLFLFPVCLLILWTASAYVGQSWAVREGSTEQSGIPALFLLKSCIPAFAVLLMFAGFAIAARAGETLRAEKG